VTAELGRGAAGVFAALLPGVRPAGSAPARRRQLAEGLAGLAPDAAWLLLAVLGPGLPTAPEVEELVRDARLSGIERAVARIERRRRPAPPVRVLSGAVLIDVQDTATTRLSTGVQRVAREAAVRWSDRDDAVLTGWSSDRRRLVRLDEAGFRAGRRTRLAREAIVPWRGTYVLPESVNETARTLRIHALAASGAGRTAAIGHDAIPLTTAETAGPGMPGAFAKYLAALGRMDLVVTTSTASAAEYRGWRAMLGSAGLTGPRVETAELAVTPLTADPADEGVARDLLGTDLPVVLCVGSHEPRKNHRAVLHAAELAWRAGARFRLVFVGGDGWGADGSRAAIDAARAASRPVTSLSGLTDSLLAWAYRLARVSVFPSLNEGFGLPVAESLAAGTPVITSDFGSMAELAARGGALLVDPRDEHALADAIARVVTDDREHERLRRAATAAPPRSWDDYADEVWRLIVE
jgi:glycosyltransferase involved in cell wall biosynthesis